jgi:hypothetical protein
MPFTPFLPALLQMNHIVGEPDRDWLRDWTCTSQRVLDAVAQGHPLSEYADDIPLHRQHFLERIDTLITPIYISLQYFKLVDKVEGFRSLTRAVLWPWIIWYLREAGRVSDPGDLSRQVYQSKEKWDPRDLCDANAPSQLRRYHTRPANTLFCRSSAPRTSGPNT